MFSERLLLARVVQYVVWEYLHMRLFSRLLATSFPVLLMLSGAAMADTCNSFATYTCAKGVHNGAFIGGAGTLIAAPGDGLLLSGNTFTVSTHNVLAGRT
jgi:hypothetical protein